MAGEPVPDRRELFDLLVSQLSEFVIVLANEEGNFTSWHPGVQTHFGYSREEFIGQSIDLLLPIPERLRGVGRRELERAAESGRMNDTRWLVKKNGQRLLGEGVTIGLRDASGRIAGFGKVLRDVTERRNAEDSLRALAGALDQSTVIVRRWDGVINHWTAGCERLYGWTAQEALGQNVHELLKAKYPEPLQQIQQQLLLSGIWTGELEHVRRDGTRIFISAHWVLLSDGSEEPPSVIETHADITARVQMQEAIERANERLKNMAQELERSNQELEEFARIASHDLGAPLTSTRWLVDLFSSRHGGQLNEEGRKYLQQISRGLERMSDLMDSVLTHAKVGRTPIATSEGVHAGEALAVALENLRQHLEMSGAAVSSDPLPEVSIEPQALNQLFQNLLSNAIKYRRPEVQLTIKIGAARQGAMWLFSVSDNGIGIAREWFERIFQPMQRAHSGEIAGSGIGLATCKKIVTRAGGSIWVDSELGRGSTFYFTLPGINEAQERTPQ
jgi:PAS domain S-box-containing protein